MKEYDCWLQGGFKAALKAELLAAIRAEEGGVPDKGTDAAILRQAAVELRDGLLKRFGVRAVLSGEPGESGIFLGRASWFLERYGERLPEIGGPGGFHIGVSEDRVVIAGTDAAGTLYGVFRFLALLALGEIKPGSAITESPAVSFRALNHWDNIEGTIERGYAGGSLFFKDGEARYDAERLCDYARLLASVGINVLSINNVNVRTSSKLITEDCLPQVAAIAGIFRPYGVRLLLSVNFSSPEVIGGLDTSDPLDPKAAAWWKERAALVYRYIPDLWGFLVKADSEGEGGPFQYGRTHADGANMLAAALQPFKGECVWRCFVYDCAQDWRNTAFDRARAAYDHFKPLDGQFADNVILQIKHGPYDFQVREPVSPLFGALTKTRHTMEFQITQEYTGQQIDLCFLPWMWQDVMAYDTGYGAKVRELLGSGGKGSPSASARGGLEGLAAVANTGLDNNWTGHTLAQANLYGYGRLCWNPALGAEEIAREWCGLTFGPGKTARVVREILLASYPAYQKYNAPFGVCFMVEPRHHYGPSIEGYEFSRWGTYHRAGREAIGVDRTGKGTGYSGQYPPAIAAVFDDPKRCPEDVLLFFHRLRYDFRMKNGKTLLQNIYDTHFEGYDEAEAMLAKWQTLENALPAAVYQSVRERLERQLVNAREWRDQVNTYFYRHTLIPDEQGRKIYA
ncbi:MAG: alpha-glucuronidase [Spirochaetaceae bacterium]|nr:alpha-glucuronidase [Spirochaetaceae bacterium]